MMTKEIINQIIAEREDAFIDVPSNLKALINIFLETYLTKWNELPPKEQIIDIKIEIDKYLNWQERLVNKKANLERETVEDYFKRVNFFHYPNTNDILQSKIWSLTIECCYTFLGTFLPTVLRQATKPLLETKAIRFETPTRQGHYIFVNNNHRFPSYISTSFWLNRMVLQNIEIGIGLHINDILKEKGQIWFDDIKKGVLVRNMLIEEQKEFYKLRLNKDILPLSSDLDTDNIENPNMYFNIDSSLVLPYITLDSIEYYHQNYNEKEPKTSIQKEIARKVVINSTIGENNPVLKELFKKIRAFHTERFIRNELQELDKPFIEKKDSSKEIKENITARVWALYYYYLQVAEIAQRFSEHPKGVEFALKEVCKNTESLGNWKYFQQIFNEISTVSGRLNRSNLNKNYPKVISLLNDYPKAQKLAIEDEKKTKEKVVKA